MAYSWRHTQSSKHFGAELWAAIWFIPANLAFMLFVLFVFLAHGRKAALRVMQVFDQF